MQRQNIIVLTMVVNMPEIIMYGEKFQECYGNLKKACKVHEWSYSTMSKKRLPQIKDGWLIQRVPFN